jgi:hypothetical protein
MRTFEFGGADHPIKPDERDMAIAGKLVNAYDAIPGARVGTL